MTTVPHHPLNPFEFSEAFDAVKRMLGLTTNQEEETNE